MGRPKHTTTHCKRGHEFTAENTYMHPGVKYRRACKTCRAERDAKSRLTRVFDKEQRARHYLLNAKRLRKATNTWRAENPEKNLELKRNRRALEEGSVGEFTKEEWFLLCFSVGFRCLCCGKKKKLTADHVVPLSKGGVNWLYNIQPLCKSCNSKKGTRSTDYRESSAYAEEQDQPCRNILNPPLSLAHS